MLLSKTRPAIVPYFILFNPFSPSSTSLLLTKLCVSHYTARLYPPILLFPFPFLASRSGPPIAFLCKIEF